MTSGTLGGTTRARRRGEEGHVLRQVVAHRVGVVAAARQLEAVDGAVVELHPGLVPQVARHRVPAALEVGRQVVGVDRVAGAVRVAEPGLAAVGPGHPAQEVVEGAVLHHHHDKRVDGDVAAGAPGAAGLLRRSRGDQPVGAEGGGEPEANAYRGGRAGEELATSQALVGSNRVQLLGVGRIEHVGHEEGEPTPYAPCVVTDYVALRFPRARAKSAGCSDAACCLALLPRASIALAIERVERVALLGPAAGGLVLVRVGPQHGLDRVADPCGDGHQVAPRGEQE